MEEINLSEIFQIFWKRKVQILVIILIFIIVGLIYTLKFVTPKYSSSITMILVSDNSNSNTNSVITTTDITLNSKLIATYSKLIKSKTVLKEVISNLDIEIDENTLKNDITVSSISNTELIQITVTNKNNELAAKIANEIANVFPEKIKQMYNIDNIKLMSEAGIENEPSNINHKKDLMLFTIFGVAVSIGYVMIANLLDTTIKGSETIEEEFKLPVLTCIPSLPSQNNKNGGKK